VRVLRSRNAQEVFGLGGSIGGPNDGRDSISAGVIAPGLPGAVAADSKHGHGGRLQGT
jgi:hypothetical protein